MSARKYQSANFDNKMVQSVSGVQTLMIKLVQSVSIVLLENYPKTQLLC